MTTETSYVGNDAWRNEVTDGIGAARSTEPTIAIQTDAGYTTRAADKEFRDRYKTEVLPTRVAAWDLALAALTHYGRPMRYSSGFNGRPSRSPLSTGMLMLCPPTPLDTIDQDKVVPIIRLKVPDNNVLHPMIGKALRAYHRACGTRREAAKLAALTGLVEEVDIEVWHATNNEQRVPSGAYLVLQREMVYPRTLRERELHDFHDDGSRQYIGELLKFSPDTVCWTWALPAFGTSNRYSIAKPTVPDWHAPDLVEVESARRSVDRALDAAKNSTQKDAVLVDMLTSVTGSLSFEG
jgi:hypothetical protein